jgi:hypothetical protein
MTVPATECSKQAESGVEATPWWTFPFVVLLCGDDGGWVFLTSCFVPYARTKGGGIAEFASVIFTRIGFDDRKITKKSF